MMTKTVVRRCSFALAFLVCGYALGRLSGPETVVSAQQDGRVFEMRTYTAPDGKLDALHARFRDHTVGFFKKHGMTSVGYWVPADGPTSQNTIVYVLAYPSREAAKKSWDAFRNDPDWQKARKESEAQGPIVSKVESVYLTPTDYSPIK